MMIVSRTPPWRRLAIALVAAGCLAMAHDSLAQKIDAGILNRGHDSPASSKSDDAKVHVLHVQGGVYMLVGAGPNITVQVGPDSLLVVDAGTPDLSDDVLAAIRKLSERPIEFIVDTSADADHTGGNHNLAKTGWFVPVENAVNPEFSGAAIIAHINALNSMSLAAGGRTPVAQNLWPTDTYDTDFWAVFTSEPVIIEHPRSAHTDGDSFVFFRRSDVISTGDIFTPSHYPVIDLQNGGSLHGTIDALNRILEVIVPDENEEGGTYVIPGHGHLCDITDVANYRDMVTIVRDRIQDLVNKGMTLEQVKAAKPTFDYDVIYGSDTGPWATDTFIETAYRELSKSHSEPGRGAQ
ncbi:MAG: MBL fold metallo-hydrolase [Candidatus Acidiferrales bacterium]|jgi:glyoxylase-like metal-dependent hydrolase (beta-lactamase superfamily II)